MNGWIDDLCTGAERDEPAVLVTVAAIRGSAPREVGARMVVTAEATLGTIGGGQLEFECTRLACGMLDAGEAPALRKFPLGPSMGQCCGGVVEILFEPVAESRPAWLKQLHELHLQRLPTAIVTDLAAADGDKVIVTAGGVSGEQMLPAAVIERTQAGLDSGKSAEMLDGYFVAYVSPSDRNIAVFGAGHVGTAVVRALSALDCNVRWIDNRRDIFPTVPAGITVIESPAPALEVDAMPAGSCYLVMTHSHSLDFDICSRILQRGDAAYTGLIGSLTKRRRFEKRFLQHGLTRAQVDRLTCPIGVDGISGKKPAEIAISASAQLLQVWEREGRASAYPSNVHAISRQR